MTEARNTTEGDNGESEDRDGPLVPPLDGLTPEEALEGFLQVDPEKVREAEKREKEEPRDEEEDLDE